MQLELEKCTHVWSLGIFGIAVPEVLPGVVLNAQPTCKVTGVTSSYPNEPPRSNRAYQYQAAGLSCLNQAEAAQTSNIDSLLAIMHSDASKINLNSYHR